ncbi:MAG: portal protein [Cetobacterium sp.]|uniref:portal protein n=1 Tax=Cetobacterium sp. TaxID=2071632 RepID=UPI003EE569EC
METKDLQYYYDLAKKAKDSTVSVYNEVLKFTDSTYQILDAESDVPTPVEIDPVIPVALNDLTSFLMTSMFSRSQKWASISMNNKLYKLVNGTLEDYQVDDTLKSLNTKLEIAGDVTFTYLNQSNYYNEVARSLREAVNIGNGAYRIIETENMLVPFIFQYVPQNDLFFTEDTFGRPNYIFRFCRKMNAVSLKKMFGEEIKIPTDLKDPNKDTVTVIECITPHEEDPNLFVYQIMTVGFAQELLMKELDYSPINIFRWNKEGNNPMGIGLSVTGLKAFKDLKSLKEKRTLSADKLLDPPIFLRGDKQLAMALSLEAKAVNYGGANSAVPLGSKSDVTLEPIQTVGTLLPLENDIREKEMYIKELFTSNPIGNTDDFKRRTALEVETRLNALRKKWALSFELLERELLMPAFLTPLRILVRKNQIDFEAGDLDLTMINYKNALALSQDVQAVEMVSMYLQQAQLVTQSAEANGLNSNRTLTYFMDNLGIPLELRMDDQEMESRREQAQAAMAQQMQSQGINMEMAEESVM